MKPFPMLLTLSVLHLCPFLSEGVDDVIVRICPSRKRDWDAAARRKECSTKGGNYHCIRNQVGKLVETCLPKMWIDPGKCPILFGASGKFGYEPCPKGKPCPLSRYLSDTVYQYSACIEKKTYETTSMTRPFFLGTTIFPTFDNENNSSARMQNKWSVPVITAVAGLLSVCILLGIVAYYKFKHKGSKSDQNTVTMDEEQALLSDALGVYLIQPLDASLHNEITIQCIIRGNSPATNITWKKDGVPIVISDNEKYEVGNITEPYLTIKNISMDDAGTYQCSATSDEGTGESEPVNLYVVENPHTFQDIELTERQALQKAEKIIEEEGMVVLVGDIGSGKTTATLHAMLYVYNKDNTNDWKSVGAEYTFDEEIDTEKADKRIIIVLDDCCGKYGTNPVYLNQMKEKLCRLQSIVKNNFKKRKVILTLTSAQFGLIENSLQDADEQSFLKCSIKLYEISDEERKAELAEYLKSRNCRCLKCKEVTWFQVKKIIEKEIYRSSLLVIGWPLICRLVVIPHIAQNIGEFIDKPLSVLQEGLEELQRTDTAAYGGLVYIMLKGGALDEDSIDYKCLSKILKLHSCLPDHDQDLLFSTKLIIQQLKAIPEYVKYINGKFTFFHDIVTLALFCSFYKRYPNETIQYCDLSIIADLFRPENYVSSAEGKVELLLEEFFTREGTSYSGRKTAKNPIQSNPKSNNPKSYFMLSEENHKVFMRRVLDEGKFSLFKGHPLMPEDTYNQIN